MLNVPDNGRSNHEPKYSERVLVYGQCLTYQNIYLGNERNHQFRHMELVQYLLTGLVYIALTLL